MKLIIDLLVDKLGSSVNFKSCEGGQILFRRGDRPHHIFGVLEGEARMLRYSAEGAQIVIHRAKSITLFAEAALFSDHYHCDGQATENTEIAQFPKKQVLHLLQQDRDFSLAFTQHMAGQVQALRFGIELRSIRSAEDRIIAALSLRLGDGQTRLKVMGTWKDFAQDVGLTHEALYRALRRLEQAGRLHRNGMTVQLGA